jgi:hypothetical protein
MQHAKVMWCLLVADVCRGVAGWSPTAVYPPGCPYCPFIHPYVHKHTHVEKSIVYDPGSLVNAMNSNPSQSLPCPSFATTHHETVCH